jgi:AraC-like DNA-binding protein
MKKFMRKLFLLILISTPLIGTSIYAAKEKVLPKRIELSIPGESEMVVGDSRVIEVLYFSGMDNLNSPSFKAVTKRGVTWSTSSKNDGKVKIDNYGRLTAEKEGTVKVTVKSDDNDSISDTKTINIVNTPTKNSSYIKAPYNYEGSAASEVNNFQKTVKRLNKSTTAQNNRVVQGKVIWTIENFADGSDGKYVKRVDNSLKDSNRDKIQYFIGNRYLPGNGKSPISIEDDNNNGIFVYGPDNKCTHIIMKPINYTKKAELMSQYMDKYVSRMGMVSGANWNGKKWIKDINDNDGQWTGEYGSGELMRYAVLKNSNAPAKEIEAARKSALKSLKAMLILSNISGRDKTIDSKIRHLTNTRDDGGNQSSKEYLKKDAVYAIDNYPGSPNDKTVLYGKEGLNRFTLGPINQNDWTTKETPATTKRILNGFLSRTFAIPVAEKVPYHDGVFFQRDYKAANGKLRQKVMSGAERLYDFSSDEQPVLDIGNKPLPKILNDQLVFDGVKYNESDIVYKGDTSSDEIIGHLFIYKIAYDILNDNNPEEKELKSLVKETVLNLANHFYSNGYSLLDATGQGTTWGKTTRDYLNSDYSYEDCTLNSLVLLCIFKLAYYVSDEIKWQDEYKHLANDPPYEYADLADKYWKRWIWLVCNESLSDEKLYKLNPNASEVEKTRAALYRIQYPDEEMAMLSYYLLLQMEKDKPLLQKYRNGLNSWWISMSRSENPLWYLMYQLAYPNEMKTDYFGNNLLKASSWALSRYPIDTRQYQAFIDGARTDVLNDNGFSINPNKIIGHRTSKTDTKNADNPTNKEVDPAYNPKNIYEIKVLPQDERSLWKYDRSSFKNNSDQHSNSIGTAYTYTLPYWLGRYHKMLK